MVNRVKYCLLVGCCFLSVSLQAVTLKTFFFNAPFDVLPTLSQSARRDLVDFFENKQTAAMPSVFNSTIVLSAFTDDYVRLETSPVSTLQIKQLTLGERAVFLLINTTLGPLPDSRVRLYSEQWNPIPGFSLPELKPRMFLDSTRLNAEQLNRFDSISRLFVQMDADPSAPVIHVRAFFADEVPEDLLAPFKGYYTDSLTLTWNGKGFQF